MPVSTTVGPAATQASNTPVTLLGWMMFLVPALGVPSPLMLQDTLKSALVALGVLTTALVFFWQQRRRTEPLQWHGLVWLPLALMAYALGSMVWSHTYLAGVEAIRWFLLGLLLWLGLNVLTRENRSTLLWGIHAGAVVASLWVALQFWFDLGWFPQGAAPASTFVNRNFFAEYVVSVLPLSAWLLLSMPPSRKLHAMAGSIALCVLAILMTGTRSALASMVVITPVIIFIGLRYRNTLAMRKWTLGQRAGVAGVLLLGISVMGVIPTGNPALSAGATPLGVSLARTTSIGNAKEYTEGSVSIRASMWKATARMVMAHPLAGVGAGAWEVEIPRFQRDDTFAETDYYAHNEYLQLLSEYGTVVGGLFIAVLWAYLLRAARRTWALPAANPADAALQASVLASLLALLMVCGAGFPLHLAACGALLMACLALLAQAELPQAGASAAPTGPPPTRLPYGVLLLISGTCLLTAGYITLQATLAERKLMNAQFLAARMTKIPALDANTKAKQSLLLVAALQEGVQINPHYRKLTGPLGDLLAAAGDWKNATWAWESVAASRPHVVGLWTFLALGYSHQGEHGRAHAALVQLQRLRPEAMETRTLETLLLSRSGHAQEAAQLLNGFFDAGLYNYDRVMTAYAIGYSTQQWPLAIRAIRLRNKTWPEQAIDGYFRLGMLYAHSAVRDDANALTAFREGYALVPADQKPNYLLQVPLQYRAHM